MVEYSEPSRTVGTSPTLRWILAPFGAFAALGFAFLLTYLVFVLIYGAEMKVKGSAPNIVMQTVATISTLIAWTWSGSRIAPPAQRKLALMLFSAPVVLMAMFALIGLRTQSDMQPGGVASAVGMLLACAGILVLAFHPRFAPPVSKRDETPPPRPVRVPRRLEEMLPANPVPPPPVADGERTAPSTPAAGAIEAAPPRTSEPMSAFKPRETSTAAPLFGTGSCPAALSSPRPITGGSKTLNKQTLRQLIDPLNQSSVAADLTAFFGRNSEIYLNHYGTMVRNQKTFPLSWNWPGFLTGYVWFFYRRMHAYGFMLLILPIILALVFPRASAGMSGALMAIGGAQSKSIYVQHAFRHILKANEMNLVGDQRVWYLRSKGGVSRAAATIAGLFLALVFAAAFLVGFSHGLDLGQLPRARNA